MTKSKTYGVCIGTPFHGETVSVQYMESLMKTHLYFAKSGIPVMNIFLYNCSLITKARNDIISQFLNNTEFEYFIFIDSDISFEPEDILKLMNYDKELIGATYSKKALNWTEIQRAIHHGLADSVGELITKTSEYTVYDEKKEQKKSDKLLEVRRLGTGFMLIKRGLLLKMKKHFKNLIYKMDDNKSKGIAIFESEVKNGEHLSEDYAFCERVIEIGGKVLIDPNIRLGHHGGNLEFFGKYQNKLIYDKEIKEIVRNTK